MKYSGTCYLEDGTGRSATFDIAKQGEHWLVVVKHAGSWHEDKSLQPAPWPLLDRLTDEAFKASIPASDTPRWDTSRKIKPVPLPVASSTWRVIATELKPKRMRHDEAPHRAIRRQAGSAAGT